MPEPSKRDEYHFLELKLSNVRSFADEQRFDFRDRAGEASRWCVVLGENGVGKTTAMQALAMMRPIPAFERGPDGQVLPLEMENGELPDPDWIEPDIFDFQNQQIVDLIRQSSAELATASMSVTLLSAAGQPVEISVECGARRGELAFAIPGAEKRALEGKGPLILGYGATRHTGTRNLADIEGQRPTESLFEGGVELADAEEVIESLYLSQVAAAAEGDEGRAAKLGGLREDIERVIRAIIPEIQRVDARVSPGERPRTGGHRGGLTFETISATLPLARLSLGYQVMVSWIVDLAWRLDRHRPDSSSPFDEHAVVIVDEIDLHLHPKWQREIRHRLLEHFPNVQFIVTTHSPIVAQEAIANQDPVAVVRWNGRAAEVLNDPLPQRTWRYDEILSSAAFALENGVDLRASEMLVERDRLVRKHELDADERARLTTLNTVVHQIESGDTPYDAAFDKLMERVVELERQLAERS